MRPLFEREAASFRPELAMVAMSIADLRLFLAREAVRTLESAQDMEPARPQDLELGWQPVQGERIPVYGLGERLVLAKQRPQTSKVTVVLVAGEESLGLLCDQIAFVGRNEVTIHEIPACMANSASPLSALVIHDGAVGCFTTGERVTSYLLESVGESRRGRKR